MNPNPSDFILPNRAVLLRAIADARIGLNPDAAYTMWIFSNGTDQYDCDTTIKEELVQHYLSVFTFGAKYPFAGDTEDEEIANGLTLMLAYMVNTGETQFEHSEHGQGNYETLWYKVTGCRPKTDADADEFLDTDFEDEDPRDYDTNDRGCSSCVNGWTQDDSNGVVECSHCFPSEME